MPVYRLGLTTFRSPAFSTSPGGDDHVAEHVTLKHDPFRRTRPILEAGDQALDAELRVPPRLL